MHDLLSLWADPDFTRFITGRPLTEEEVWLRCLRDIGHWQALGYGNWAIRLHQSDQFIGTVGILNFRRDITPTIADPELGWGLSPHFQGLGLAREAVSAALDWADDNLSSHRTLCMISPENTASVRLADKLGYQTWVTTQYHDNDVVLFQRPRRIKD